MGKIIQWIVVVVILTVLAWLTYNYMMARQGFENNSAFAYVPDDAPFILEIKDLHELILTIKTNNKIQGALQNIPSYQQFSEELYHLDTTLIADPFIGASYSGQSILITAGLTGKEKFDLLYLTGFPNQDRLEAGVGFVKQYFGNVDQWQEKEYDKQSIFFTTQNPVSYAVINGVLIISKSSKLIESAIRQSTSSGLLREGSDFLKIKTTAGKNSLANLYLNHRHCPGFLTMFFDDKYTQSLLSMENYASWSEFDITIKEQELFMNGFTLPTDNHDYLKIFDQQKPVAIDVESVLPANTSTFFSYGISDVSAFRRNIRKYHGINNLSSKYSDELSEIHKKYNIDIEEIIYSLIDQEVVIAFTDVKSNDKFENCFLLIKAQSKSLAQEVLIDLINAHAEQHNKTTEDYIFMHRFDEEVTQTIYFMPFNNFGELVFGGVFGNIQSSFFTFIGNYIVFGHKRKALGNFINDNLLHKNLANDFDYLEFSSQTADKCNVYFYTAPAASLPLYPGFFKGSVKSGIENNADVFMDFHGLSFQFAPHGKDQMVYNDIYLKYGPLETDKPRTKWELRLDTTFSHKPKLVVNHSTGNREIFVQDDNNKVYLINYAGRILWQKQLSQPIISDIFQIDYYKNNKLQFLFNTKNKLHLVDRLGNYVERYPINLNSPATNGVGLVDYTNNKDYRLFIACENKHVYLYSKEGNKIDGWKFKKAEHGVTGKVQHFLSKNKDYIVFNDVNKSYILNRRGRERVKPEMNFSISKNGNYIYESQSPNNEARMVITGPDGTIYFVYFDGKVESLRIREFSNNHYFDYRDFDGDNLKDFIFIDGKKLEVYNLIQSKLLDLQFDEDIEHAPLLYVFPGNQRKLGVVAENHNEIYLINNDGSLYEGFPLQGRTPFSIGSITGNRKFNLFVGTDDSFLYNYEIK